MAKLGGERASVQNTLINYCKEIGWEYITPEDALSARGGEAGIFFNEVFASQLHTLNSGFIDDSLIEQLVGQLERLPNNIEGNLSAWEYLKGSKTIYVPKEKRERDVIFIDENPANNIYQVTDEFSYTNGKYTNRFDVVFLINGIPVFFVEAKSAHKLNGIAEALDQTRRYHNETPQPLTFLQVYTLTHIVHFYFSATWNFSTKSLFNWKLEIPTHNYEQLVKNFFDKERVLQTLLHYILFTRKDDTLEKVILRPHQMRAIQKIEERALDTDKNRALIWHTQGSGKTYTMILAAKRILENPLLENPTVLLLVDRNELESQLFTNLSSAGFEGMEDRIATSKNNLKKLLSTNTRGLLVTMIHKFEGMEANINTNKNIFVLIDEAHRTTSGHLGNYLMGALPNATYIGFTGTPIDKTNFGKGTFVIFGKDDPPYGYLDKYDIAQSIEDGTTVKLNYTIAKNELLPNKEILEREFLNLAEAQGLSDIETLNNVLEKAVNLKNMMKNRERVAKIAKYVAEHYQDYVEPLGYKAFLVAVDREACTFYKEELDKYLPPEYSEVVYSPAHNDNLLLKKYHLSDVDEKKIRKSFRKANEYPKILIVTEKLLTGYDAPVLYCMYLDKPMRDHVLLQAIARVNRPYEDEKGKQKPCGFVLDFVGIFDKLEKALAYDSKDIEGVVQDIQKLKDTFVEMMEKGKTEYLQLLDGKAKDKAVEAILEYFRDDEARKEYFTYYKELADTYEILSPDAFLRPYIDDYDTFSRIFNIVKEAYEPGLILDYEFARKTAKLVQEHTKSGKIIPSLEVYEINEKTIRKIEESQISDIEKISNILKSIALIREQETGEKPYLISIAERAETLSLLFQQRQTDTVETLEELKKLIEEIIQAEKEQAEKGMNSDVFSVYWLMKKDEVNNADSIANNIQNIFNQFPYWRESGEQERKVKQNFHTILKQDNVPMDKAVGIVSKIMKILKR